MRELGWPAAAFDLPSANPDSDSIEKATRSLGDYSAAKAVVVVFTCNHCPYAVHVESELIQIAHDYADKGVQLLAVCSNDAANYPADSFEAMTERAHARSYPFPYLHDESQAVAREYGAACTPDTFVFNQNRNLVYRGRIDESRPGRGVANGADLRRSLDALLAGAAPSDEQHPSIGCSIKWRA